MNSFTTSVSCVPHFTTVLKLDPKTQKGKRRHGKKHMRAKLIPGLHMYIKKDMQSITDCQDSIRLLQLQTGKTVRHN